MSMNEGHKPVFSVSILCFNQLDLTKKCIKSILSSSTVPYELLITDNGSWDDTPKWLLTLRNKHIKLTLNNTNLGFKQGHINALEKAQGDYFIALNNDTLVGGKWLQIIQREFEKDSAVKVVGPVGCVFDANGDGGRHVREGYEYIEGCCMAIPTVFAKEIGLFAPEYEFAFCEDSDLSLRVRQMGHKIKRCDIDFYHKSGGTCRSPMTKERVDIRFFLQRNQEIFKKKWAEYLKTRTFTSK